MKTTLINPQATCYKCNHVLDAHTDIEDTHSPKTGDISICIHCGAISIYGTDLQLHKPSHAQIQELKDDDMAWQQIMAFQDIIRETPSADWSY